MQEQVNVSGRLQRNAAHKSREGNQSYPYYVIVAFPQQPDQIESPLKLVHRQPGYTCAQGVRRHHQRMNREQAEQAK